MDDLLANTVFTPIAFARIVVLVVLGPWRRRTMRTRRRRKALVGVFISI
jgi:threonine/homoserine efflux transporter RhtA